MSLVRDEQTELTATFLDGVAVAAVAVGIIAPVTAASIGTASFAQASAAGGIWIVADAVGHIGARLVLRRLSE